MKVVYLLIWIFFNSICVIAQKRLQTDTSKVIVRHFDYSELQKIKADKDFQYLQLSELPRSVWDKFWDNFWLWISKIMRSEKGRTSVWIIIFLVAAAIIIFLVSKAAGTSIQGLFGRKSKGALQYSTAEEDINTISFDELIKKAISGKNFRMATRLLYLQSLKQLSDKGYIQWQKDKTNHDYILEVFGKPWQPVFKKLTYNFEWTWYGEKNIAYDEFQDVYTQFQQFNNQLQ